jgi:co-chaperonin GroES (HSP10)
MTLVSEVRPRPLGSRVLVKRAAKNEKLGQGLLVAASKFVEAPMMGTVIAIGPRVTQLRVGEIVAFANWAGVSLARLTADTEMEGLILLEEEGEVLSVLDIVTRESTADDEAKAAEEAHRNALEAMEGEAFLERLKREANL